jgi:hypothetical protein
MFRNKLGGSYRFVPLGSCNMNAYKHRLKEEEEEEEEEEEVYILIEYIVLSQAG